MPDFTDSYRNENTTFPFRFSNTPFPFRNPFDEVKIGTETVFFQ